MEEIIYLEADEEITSIVDRLKSTQSNILALVIPKRATILQSIVNLKLLKKQATELDKEIAVVTTDKMGRNLAAQVGLTVYQKIEQHKSVSKKKPTIERPVQKTPINYRGTARKPLTAFEKDKKRIPFVDLSLRQKKEENNNQDGPETGTKSPAFDMKSRRAQITTPQQPEISETIPHKKITPPPSSKKKLFKAKKIVAHLNWKIIGGFVILSLIILAFVAFLILPGATVNASLNAEEINYDLELTIDTKAGEADFETNTIPGQLIETTKEIEETFKTTGKKDIGNKATGTIVIVNKSGEEQPLLVNTQFRDNKTGKVFLTNSGAVVPAATITSGGKIKNGQTSVAVTAKESGKDYNIKESQFTIIKLATNRQSLVYGVSEKEMAGGSTNVVPIVSEDDIKKAASETLKKLTLTAKEDLKNQISEGMEIDEGLINKKTESAKPSVAENQQASKFTYLLKVKFTTIAYNPEQIRQLAKEKIENLTAKDKEVITDSLEISYHKSKLNSKKKKITSIAKIKGKAVNKINEDDLKQELKGRSKEESESYLKTFEEISDATVSFWPFWVKSIPSNNSRVNLEFSY